MWPTFYRPAPAVLWLFLSLAFFAPLCQSLLSSHALQPSPRPPTHLSSSPLSPPPLSPPPLPAEIILASITYLRRRRRLPPPPSVALLLTRRQYAATSPPTTPPLSLQAWDQLPPIPRIPLDCSLDQSDDDPPVKSIHSTISSSRFKDPVAAVTWYEARWGGKVGRGQEEGEERRRRERKVMERLKRVDVTTLSDPALLGMSDEEVLKAVVEYRRVRGKKVEITKCLKSAEEMRVSSREKRERARARALKAYKTRRKRMAKMAKKMAKKNWSAAPEVAYVGEEEGGKKTIVYSISGRSMTAKSALVRIQLAVAASGPVRLADVAKVGRPAKLGGRKAVLKEVVVGYLGGGGTCDSKTVAELCAVISSHSFDGYLYFGDQTFSRAFSRIKALVESGGSVMELAAADVRLVCDAGRFGGRRELLIRVVREVLRVDGRCVPAMGSRKRGAKARMGVNLLEYPDRVSVERLGEFIEKDLERAKKAGGRRRRVDKGLVVL